MAVGLGTGSTAIFATRRSARVSRPGELRDIVGYATSDETRHAAAGARDPLLALELDRRLDVTIDGADEGRPGVEPHQGGGGAHLREKIVAQASDRELIVVDESKLSPRLGTHHALPLEGARVRLGVRRPVTSSRSARRWPCGCGPTASGYRTDQDNLVLDATFGPIADAATLADRLAARAGIVAHGLFLGLTSEVFVPARARAPPHASLSSLRWRSR